MNKRNLFVLLSLIVAVSMVLSACGTPATEAPATEAPTAAPTEAPTAAPTEAMPAIGSPEHPIKVLFVPSVDANVIVTDANQGGREALSGAMMRALAAFARSGDPNDAALGTAWPNWPRVLLFDASATAKRITVQ